MEHGAPRRRSIQRLNATFEVRTEKALALLALAVKRSVDDVPQQPPLGGVSVTSVAVAAISNNLAVVTGIWE